MFNFLIRSILNKRKKNKIRNLKRNPKDNPKININLIKDLVGSLGWLEELFKGKTHLEIIVLEEKMLRMEIISIMYLFQLMFIRTTKEKMRTSLIC